jgi:hypothetical protein
MLTELAFCKAIVPNELLVSIVNKPGVDQVIVGAFIKDETNAIETQTCTTVDVGGVVDQPVGGVPTLVAKFQDPPVGVGGAELLV